MEELSSTAVLGPGCPSGLGSSAGPRRLLALSLAWCLRGLWEAREGVRPSLPCRPGVLLGLPSEIPGLPPSVLAASNLRGFTFCVCFNYTKY